MPCRRAFLLIGTLLGNLEGVRLPGLLSDKKSVSGFHFGPRGHYDFKSGGHLEL